MAEETIERETKTVTIGNHTVSLKTYLTAREGNTLRKLIFSKFTYKIDEHGKAIPAMTMDGSYAIEQELETFGLCIATIDGSDKDIKDRVQDIFTTAEYNDLKKAVDELTKDFFPKPKLDS